MNDKQKFVNREKWNIEHNGSHAYFYNEFENFMGSTKKIFKVISNGNLIYKLNKNNGYVIETSDFRYYHIPNTTDSEISKWIL